MKQAEVKQPEPKKQISGKRRDLTKEEIEQITHRHGFSIRNKPLGDIFHYVDIPEGKYVITYWIWHKWDKIKWEIYFCDDMFYWTEVFYLGL